MTALVASPPPLDPFQEIAEDLYRQGWSITGQLVPETLAWALIAEATALWDDGAFQRAGIGRADAQQLRPEIRGDRIHWLDPFTVGDAQREYLRLLGSLQSALNRTLFLGLFHFEGHFALYPPGTFYRRHLDVFRDAPERTVTCILYLNPQWQPGHGGELRIFLENGTTMDVAPRMGTLVVFLSHELEHEVLETMCERMSVTGWFKVRGLDESPLTADDSLGGSIRSV